MVDISCSASGQFDLLRPLLQQRGSGNKPSILVRGYIKFPSPRFREDIMIQGITLKRVEEPSPIVSFYVSDFNYYLFSQAIGSGVLSCHSAPLPHARKSLAVLLLLRPFNTTALSIINYEWTPTTRTETKKEKNHTL
jgi:hypothetical protein